jgi:phosphatidylglycerophosphatase A
MRRLAVLICSFGYIGFFPFAPGTVGSAAGVAVYVAARYLALPYFEMVLIVALLVAGIVFTRPCEEELRCIDPGPIVIDEVMGMLITLFMIPVGWAGILLGFALFRVLDVVKPFPARQLEQLHGGFGVMADDAMAAIYANLLLRVAFYLAPGWLS